MLADAFRTCPGTHKIATPRHAAHVVVQRGRIPLQTAHPELILTMPASGKHAQDSAAEKPTGKSSPDGAGPTAKEILLLAQGMSELASSLREFVSYLRDNPEIGEIPVCLRELSKRISVLSTRL